jgi:hypothetical protein
MQMNRKRSKSKVDRSTTPPGAAHHHRENSLSRRLNPTQHSIGRV